MYAVIIEIARDAATLAGLRRLGERLLEPERFVDSPGAGCRLREDGDLLHYVNDHRIGLECCPSSNLQTGAIRDMASHPIKLYKNLGLRVTVNTDNRLVTDTTVSKELWLCHKVLGFTLTDLKQIIMSGFKSAFLPFHVKQQYVRRISEELKSFADPESPIASEIASPMATPSSPTPSTN